MAAPLLLRKSAIVLKSGIRRPISLVREIITSRAFSHSLAALGLVFEIGLSKSLHRLRLSRTYEDSDRVNQHGMRRVSIERIRVKQPFADASGDAKHSSREAVNRQFDNVAKSNNGRHAADIFKGAKYHRA